MSNRGYNKSFQYVAIIALATLVIYVRGEGEAAEGDFQQSELIPNIAHDYNLKCGLCIGGGYDFCWKSDVGGKVLGPKDDPYHVSAFDERAGTDVPDITQSQYICCQNENDAACKGIY